MPGSVGFLAVLGLGGVLAAGSAAPGLAPLVALADPAQVSGRIIADGSSTVWPILAEAAERFEADGGDVRFDLEVSGTSGGFRRFCAGESDIAGASRPITAEELAACAAAGVEPVAFEVALDGVTIVVHPANGEVSCLTVDQLERLWRPEDPATRWQDLDAAWPDEAIDLFGPGPDSGTFDFFTEAILGEADRSRIDYTPSENDFFLVEEIVQRPESLAYFGFAYAEQAGDRVKEVAVDNGSGCVAPSVATITDGSYAPLTRPLFLYVDGGAASAATVAFLQYLSADASAIVGAAGYVPADDAAYADMESTLADLARAAGPGVSATPGAR
ncbi:MAG: PstS family phosphate ABC transporter substrate-binding protein [Chloroflexota bacterium]